MTDWVEHAVCPSQHGILNYCVFISYFLLFFTMFKFWPLDVMQNVKTRTKCVVKFEREILAI
jgi:hypothetical protein